MDEQITGGLDQVKPQEEQVLRGTALKPGAEVKYKLPVQPKEGVLPESLLADMERLYQQKVSSQSPFQEWMKDIIAWGGSAQPGTTGETLARRAKEKEQQDIDLFNMRAQIASQKAKMAQQTQQAEYLKSVTGGETPSTTAVAPTVGALGAGALPPHVAVAVKEKIKLGDIDGAQKIVDDYRKTLATEEVKFVTNPASYQNSVTVMLPDGRLQEVNPIQARKMFEAGQAAPAPMVGMPAPTIKPPAPASAPVQGPLSATDAFKFENLTPEQISTARAKGQAMGLQSDVFARPDAAELFNKQPIERRQAIFGSLTPGAETQIAQAAPAPAAPKSVPTIPQARMQLEREKAQAMADIEAGKETSKEFDKEIRDSATRARDQINTSTEIIDLVSKNKNMFGVFKKPGMASALGAVLETGVSAPGGHSIGIPQISEAVVLSTPGVTKANVAARDRVSNLLNKTALYTSSIIKGQGQVTEYERRLIEELVGSIRNTPENLIKIQKVMKANAEAAKERDALYSKSGLSAREFRNSDQYRAWQDKYDSNLEKIYKEPLSVQGVQTAPQTGKTKSGITWKVVQ